MSEIKLGKCKTSAKEVAEYLHDELIVKRSGRVSRQEMDRLIDQASTNWDKCPECGAKLIHESGCVRCMCGWSRC